MIVNYGLEQYLFLFIVTEVVIGILIPLLIIKVEKEKIIERKTYSLLEFLLYVLVGMTFITIFALIGQYYGFGNIDYKTGNTIGFLLFFAGILLQGIAEATLGKYYLPYFGVAEGQKIIKEGIYKYIRHPGY
ncbi:MAG: isoprenylcysteine carboxylmethyltransferase family protein, partial [Nanopusillaceae archaeon]